MIRKITGILILATVAALAQNQAPAGPPTLAARQIKPGLFMITGAGCGKSIDPTVVLACALLPHVLRTSLVMAGDAHRGKNERCSPAVSTGAGDPE